MTGQKLTTDTESKKFDPSYYEEIRKKINNFIINNEPARAVLAIGEATLYIMNTD
jgi:hypothetical protein